jgi:hypothetical protein
MTKLDNFVRPLPDIFLRRKKVDAWTNDEGTLQEYLLETLESGIMSWILKKQIQAHQTLAEDFEDEFKRKYPTLLFVCGNDSTERRIQKIVENGYLDFEISTTTRERLESQGTKIWRAEWDEDEVVLSGL